MHSTIGLPAIGKCFQVLAIFRHLLRVPRKQPIPGLEPFGLGIKVVLMASEHRCIDESHTPIYRRHIGDYRTNHNDKHLLWWTALKEAALQFVKDCYINQANKRLKKRNLPDYSGTMSLGCIASLDRLLREGHKVHFTLLEGGMLFA